MPFLIPENFWILPQSGILKRIKLFNENSFLLDLLRLLRSYILGQRVKFWGWKSKAVLFMTNSSWIQIKHFKGPNIIRCSKYYSFCAILFAQSYPKAPGGSVKVLSMNFVKCIHIKAHAQNSPGTNCNQLIIDTRFRDWTEVACYPCIVKISVQRPGPKAGLQIRRC